MAILEINLEKPALVEEYQYPSETPARTQSSADRSDSAAESGSSGGKGKLLGLLAVAVGVGLLAYKRKSRGGDEQTDFDEFEAGEEYEYGSEAEFEAEEGGGAKRKVAGVLGLVLAVVGLVAAVQRRRR